MKVLQTIESIHSVYETGSRPVLVTCDDRNWWVCKSGYQPSVIFNELIAAQFAKIWRIRVPDSALIQVQEEHVPAEFIPFIQKSWFKKECFGSIYSETAKEFDHATLPMFKDRNFRNKFRNKSDFLKIALFDIWLGNEDRNYNNFNLLFDVGKDGYYHFFAIDHGAIFNTSSLDYGMCQLTEDDSILKTDLAKVLFSKDTATHRIVNELIEMYYLCTLDCKNRLPEILSLVPQSWNLDMKDLERKISDALFSDQWLASCEDTFRDFIKFFILN